MLANETNFCLEGSFEMKGISKVVAVSPVTALVEELDCVF